MTLICFPLTVSRRYVTFRAAFSLSLLLVFGTIITHEATAQLSNYFELSERVLNFDTTCGTTQCREVVLRSINAQPLIIKAIETPAAPFALDASTPIALPVNLNPLDSIQLLYCYSPLNPVATDNGRIIIAVDTGDAANFAFDTIELNGRSRAAVISIDPPTINFGNVSIGQQSCVTVTVRNDGDELYNVATLNEFGFSFMPNVFPALPIPPRDSIQLEVCFAPITPESFLDTLSIANGGCGDPPTLIAQGTGLDSIANIGPVLQIVPLAFDTTLCGTTECRTLTLRNVGTDSLQVTQADQIVDPFTGAISPLPVAIAPDEERKFTLCYAPTDPTSRDTLALNFVSDNRVSLSIAAVFDVSESMSKDFNGISRTEAANNAGRSFLSNLINDPGRGVIDEAAVYQFSDLNNIKLLEGYSTDIPALQAAVPNTNGGVTCLYDAVVRAASDLSARNIPGRRVIVVLTDGRNNCGEGPSISLEDVINTAQATGVRIYTIGIGTENVLDMTKLADSTGGFFSEAMAPAELLKAYQRIANSLSQNQESSFVMTGQSVAPDLSINPTSIFFDSVRVGQSLCRTVTLKNTGDVPLDIGTLTDPSEHYRVNPTTFPPILPGESANVEMCFEPNRLRELNSTIVFPFVRCTPMDKTVSLEGIGYDSVVISITGNFTARPESRISVPVTLIDQLPDEYEVDSLELTFRYNKTMLFPEPENRPLNLAGTLTEPMTNQKVDPTYDPQDAFLRVSLPGGRLVNPAETGLLTNLGLIALHGNALTTPIEISSARFADGNPKVGIINNAQFTADSLCFQERRLVDASARFGPVAKLVSLNQDFAVVRVSLEEDAFVRSELYDPLGRFSGRVVSGERSAGNYELRIDLRDLPSGLYLLRTIIGNEAQLTTPLLH